MSLHAIVQGFCRFDNISKLPASNILESSTVSNVTIVLHCFAYSTTTTMAYSISRGISRGLQIFRLLLRPSATITAYWRCNERVYFGGLETGLEKAV